MKKLALGLMVLMLSGCGIWGYSSKNNEMIGQVKKVRHNTPIFCGDYISADISLGIMRGGVGSMSTQDVWVTVYSQDFEKLLKRANETGELVKIGYDERRVTFCIEEKIVNSVEFVK